MRGWSRRQRQPSAPAAVPAGVPAPRLLFAGVAAVLVCIVWLVGWMLLDARRVAAQHAAQSAENLAAAFEHDIQRTLAMYALSLETVVDGLRLPEIASFTDDIRRRVLFDGAANAPHLGSTIVLDADGRVAIASEAGREGSESYADREFFQTHRILRDANLHISAPFKDGSGGIWQIAISRRIDDRDGSFAGVVFGTLHLDFFRQLFNRIDIGPNGAISLFRNDGKLLYRTPHREELIGENLRNQAFFRAQAAAESSIFETRSAFDGIVRIFAMRQVRDLPLVLTVGLARDTVFAEWKQKAVAIVTAVAGLATIVALLAAAFIGELRRRERTEAALRLAKEQADTANRAKSAFLGSMSHELRTPLNAIIGFAEVMQQGILGPIGNEQYRSYIADIQLSGTHLLQLINEILDLTKAEAGKLELHEEIVDVTDIVRSVVRVSGPAIERAELTATLDLPLDMPLMRADARMTRQLFFNLVGNAAKFTPPGGHIGIHGRFDAEAGVVIAVSDTGIGIAPENLDRVFDPFVQVDSSLARRHAGTGLGLPMVKAIVELHRGTIEVNSTVGIGTTVTITYPPEMIVANEPAEEPRSAA